MKLIIAVCVLLTWSTHVAAAENFALFGVGTKSCGGHIAARAEKNASYVLAARSWLTGYLTALNYVPGISREALSRIDLDGADLWLENYCKQNPLDLVSAAADNLRLELVARSANR